jgi:hypothetical protein
MPRVRFEPMSPVFEPANTFPTPDCTATVIDYFSFSKIKTGSFGASQFKSVATFRWMAGPRVSGLKESLPLAR